MRRQACLSQCTRRSRRDPLLPAPSNAPSACLPPLLVHNCRNTPSRLCVDVTGRNPVSRIQGVETFLDVLLQLITLQHQPYSFRDNLALVPEPALGDESSDGRIEVRRDLHTHLSLSHVIGEFGEQHTQRLPNDHPRKWDSSPSILAQTPRKWQAGTGRCRDNPSSPRPLHETAGFPTMKQFNTNPKRQRGKNI